jgi:hypothetical protein
MPGNRQRDIGRAAPVRSVVLWSGLVGGRITGCPPKRVTARFPRLTSASVHGVAVQHPGVR